MSSDPVPSSNALQRDISQLRTAYSHCTFTEDQLVSFTNPFEQFHAWFEEALGCREIAEANAMSVSTVSETGRPSSRMVLMKGYSVEEGFKFYTNVHSRKAREMEKNPSVSLLFYWPQLHRQVRIEGWVDQIEDEKVCEYFSTRPRPSQLSAIASPQSQPIQSRDELVEKLEELSRKYSDMSVPVPKPEHWGGYRVHPRTIEFWQGQSTRLHDRIVFEKKDGSEEWTVYRLAP